MFRTGMIVCFKRGWGNGLLDVGRMKALDGVSKVEGSPSPWYLPGLPNICLRSRLGATAGVPSIDILATNP
jgi:hypothetical protein